MFVKSIHIFLNIHFFNNVNKKEVFDVTDIDRKPI